MSSRVVKSVDKENTTTAASTFYKVQALCGHSKSGIVTLTYHEMPRHFTEKEAQQLDGLAYQGRIRCCHNGTSCKLEIVEGDETCEKNLKTI